MPDRKPKISERHLQLLRHLLRGLIIVALIGILVFGVRAVNSSRAWRDAPAEDIAAWMTPRYVAMSQHVPPRVIEDVITAGDDVVRHKTTLEDIALMQGTDIDQLIIQLETAINDFKDARRD
jgi:hypothetical protein